MFHEKTAVPDDLLQLKQRLEEWRTANPPRTRLPESFYNKIRPLPPKPPGVPKLSRFLVLYLRSSAFICGQ
jgi:hypothetical protein